MWSIDSAALAHNAQVNVLTRSIVILLLIISITTISKQLAASGQVNVHRLQGCHIGKGARMNQVLHWLALCGGNQLHTKTVKKPSFGGYFASVFFTLY